MDIIWNETEFTDKLEMDTDKLADWRLRLDVPQVKQDVLRASIMERMELLIMLSEG